MKLSLITINRNNAPGLRRTLKSVEEQTIPKDQTLEHIIVDGESTDDSLSHIPPRTNTIITKPLGVYNAINTGLKASDGDIIGLLHAGDCFANKEILSNIFHFFESNPEVDYIYGDVRIGYRLYTGDNFDIARLSNGSAPPHPSLYIRRRVYDIVGSYDESYKTAADFDYFVRLALAENLKGRYIPGVMVEMETGGMSQSLYNRLWTNNKERLRSLRNNGLPASRWQLISHYRHVLKQFICSSKKKQ